MFRFTYSVVLSILASVAGCASSGRPPAASVPPPPVRSGQTLDAQHGVVVSVCRIASTVGANVLRDGGNAVDAAVATAFALAVTWPEAGNIGGGGFMMVGEPSRVGQPAVHFIDYRETGPAEVKADTFAGKPTSHQLAGTPGTVRGLFTAHQTYGTKRFAWKDLVLPAAKIAEEGFVVDAAAGGLAEQRAGQE